MGAGSEYGTRNGWGRIRHTYRSRRSARSMTLTPFPRSPIAAVSQPQPPAAWNQSIVDVTFCSVLITATDLIINKSATPPPTHRPTALSPTFAPTNANHTNGTSAPTSWIPEVFDAKNCDTLGCFLTCFYGISTVISIAVFAAVPLLRLWCPDIFAWRIRHGMARFPAPRRIELYAREMLSRWTDFVLPLVWVRSLFCRCGTAEDRAPRARMPMPTVRGVCDAVLHVFGLECATLLMPMSEVRRIAGTDAVLELRLLQMMRQICLVCCFFGLPLLLVNYCGTGRADATLEWDDLKRWQINYVANDSKLLLYDIVYMWLVTISMLWIVHRHIVGATHFAGWPIHKGFDGLVQLRQAHLSALRPENFCVLVRNVKSHQRSAPRLLTFFQSVFAGGESAAAYGALGSAERAAERARALEGATSSVSPIRAPSRTESNSGAERR